MISNKTAAVLLLITLNIELAASTSNGTQKPSLSKKATPHARKQMPKFGLGKVVLRDTSNAVKAVEVVRENTEKTGILQGQPTPQISKQFEELINQGRYNELFEHGKKMKIREFVRQLYLVGKTFEQYYELIKHLRKRKMVASFYIYGYMEVVKEAIVASKAYDGNSDATGDDLEIAISLALNDDNHDRVIELIKARKEIITAEEEALFKKQGGLTTKFESFVHAFLYYLVPEDNSMVLKRFLTLRGDELRDKYPEILDTICQNLVVRLRFGLFKPKTRKLLTDLIGQPSLLTSVSFAKGFLFGAFDEIRSNFIKYGWDETIEEGLKKEYLFGGEHLWRKMGEERPTLFSGAPPSTTDALAAVRKHFQTKRQKEDQWGQENVPDFPERLEKFAANSVLPKVLMKIIIEFADIRPTWLDDGTVGAIEIIEKNTKVMDASQEQAVPRIGKRFEELIDQRKYWEVFELAASRNVEFEKLLIRLCPIIKTLEQYKGLVDQLEAGVRRGLAILFYVHGKMDIVKEAIVESEVYDAMDYVYGGDLEAAITLALNEDYHDRVVDLLKVRQEITAERDRWLTEGVQNNFERFVFKFIYHFTPWNNGMAFKRFLTLRGNELREKHSDILDTLCEKLVELLKTRLNDPYSEGLLIDLIGHPILLKPMALVKGLSQHTSDRYYSFLVSHGWRDVIGGALASEYGDNFWQMMVRKRPGIFFGAFPNTPDARVAVCRHFPTKQALEEQWIIDNTPLDIWQEIGEFIDTILPTVLVFIVLDYAKLSWIDV